MYTKATMKTDLWKATVFIYTRTNNTISVISNRIKKMEKEFFTFLTKTFIKDTSLMEKGMGMDDTFIIIKPFMKDNGAIT